MRRAINIEWDCDNEKENGLVQFIGPDSVDIPDYVEDKDVADWLSYIYEFCVYGFEIETVKNENVDKTIIHIEVDEFGFYNIYSSNENVEITIFDYNAGGPRDDEEAEMYREHKEMVENETLKLVY